MTQNDKAQRFVNRLMHETHLRYQKEQLAKDKASTGTNGLPCPEQRGCRRKLGTSELKAKSVFRPEWFSGLRPNFWRGYFDTLMYMAR